MIKWTKKKMELEPLTMKERIALQDYRNLISKLFSLLKGIYVKNNRNI
jgi:hypothetical protein